MKFYAVEGITWDGCIECT